MRVPLLSILLAACLIMSGCSGKPYGQYRNEPMIGYVSALNEEDRAVTFDVSEWMKRDEQGTDIGDWGAEYTARVPPGTKLTNEAGARLKWEHLKLGQKVQILSSGGGKAADAPEELMLMGMSERETLKRLGLFAGGEGSYRTTVLYGQGAKLPYDSDYLEREAPSVFEGGVGWLEYDPEYVLDLKKALDVGALPVFLVFDHEKLVVKTVRLANVVAFLDAVLEK
ncbi:hypothetical protein [Paenibacillus arenilitoris]|uniref:Uncharacterized protein n=1 Tax=Paenibacillus arenilitoris TaxID=2772299 RepID=A0A927CMA2_9BACL|nr:hypothetical protein [Paenibacillus arenilitoris]MBD2869437.1 hypothetical protein [Paenibacillus arenilitoris]